MRKTRYKRSNYLIKKRFQFKYTLIILSLILSVTLISSLAIYVGMWASIIENFNEFKVSQNLETAKRLAAYEDVRYKQGDYRLEKIFREAELLSAEQRNALKNALNAVNKSLLPKIAILIMAVFILGIFLSHKIAGPMYRFEKSAESIKKGDLTTDFKVRKSDEMKKTASVLDDMAESLREDIERIKKARTLEEAQRIVSKYRT